MDRARTKVARGAQGCAALWLLAWCLLASVPDARGAEDAYQIKAAFIYNFTKFVTWPAEIEQAGGDLRLCLYGGNPFGQIIYQLDGRPVRNFTLRVLQPADDSELSQCHILHLASEQAVSHLLNAVGGTPVLTIGDHHGFARDGGGIELLSENNRIRFDINLQRIKSSGLDISSRLLSLARQVL